jgi:tripartite-type tricarboxylate transporter receptor subunit TctC
LYREFVRIVQQPDVRERFTSMGMEPLTPTPDQFSAEIREAVARWPRSSRRRGFACSSAVTRRRRRSAIDCGAE